MKCLEMFDLALALTLIGVTACSSAEKTVDKRQSKVALAAVYEGELNPGDKLKVLAFPSVNLAVKAAPAAGYSLINKINATDFVLHDGKSSKLYHLESVIADLPDITPQVQIPSGSTLYSLPDGFWMVSAESLLHKKPAVADPADSDDVKTKPVSVDNFSTAILRGDTRKMKVLFVGKDEIILHVDTYIEILTIQDGKPFLNSLPIAKLPVDLSGDIAAGRNEDGGYWFKSKEGVFVLQPPKTDEALVWNKTTLKVDPVISGQMAMWLDTIALVPVGTSLGVDAKGDIVSISAAAVATK